MEKEDKTKAAVEDGGPPPYSAISPEVGVDRLAKLDRVDIRLAEIVTKHGEVIFKLKRQLQTQRQMKINFDYYDTAGRLGISFRPVHACFKSHLQIFMDDKLVSTMHIKTFCPCSRPVYFIKDPECKKQVKITTRYLFSTYNPDFLCYLWDMQGNNIGVVRKTWNGLENALFADANVFEIEFQADLDVALKAGIMGLFVLLQQEASYQRRGS